MQNPNMSNAETLTYVRAQAKKLGLTLKTQSMTINGAPAYKFIERGNDHTVIVSNMNLGMALNRVCSGELENWKTW